MLPLPPWWILTRRQNRILKLCIVTLIHSAVSTTCIIWYKICTITTEKLFKWVCGSKRLNKLLSWIKILAWNWKQIRKWSNSLAKILIKIWKQSKRLFRATNLKNENKVTLKLDYCFSLLQSNSNLVFLSELFSQFLYYSTNFDSL